MGGAPDVNEPTEDQKASAEVQAKAFNELVAGKPLEMAYIKDITAPVEGRTATIQGQVNADVMQKMGPAKVNPNKGLAGQSAVPATQVLSKAERNAATDANLQRIAGGMGIVQMGNGQASKAVTGMEGMARDSVNRAISDAEIQTQTQTNQANSIGSGLAMAAYGANKLYQMPSSPSVPKFPEAGLADASQKLVDTNYGLRSPVLTNMRW